MAQETQALSSPSTPVRWRLVLVTAVVCLVAYGASSVIRAQGEGVAGDWLTWGADEHSTRYSSLDQINSRNVQDLQVAWRWVTADQQLQESNPVWRVGRNEETPLLANGVLYTVTGLGLVAALDPATGETRWVYDPESYEAGRPNNNGFMQKGLAYWTDGDEERVLVGTGDAWLISIDARTGRPDPNFGDGGKADATVGIRDAVRATTLSARRPLVAGDVVIVGNSVPDSSREPRKIPPGYVHAFDVRTGRLLWTFHTIPKEFESGYDTWLDGSAEYNGAANVWAGMAYDPELDYVYLPSGTPTSNFSGVDRPGSNLFAESLICLEAKTGRRVWHFQAVHHGLWDYDLPAAPILGDITVDGRQIKAVMQVSKQAFTYVFDRQTASLSGRSRSSRFRPAMSRGSGMRRPSRSRPSQLRLIFKVRLRTTSSTSRQSCAGERWSSCRRSTMARSSHHPRREGTLILPGIYGGSNWGGAGFDPETGVLYVPSLNRPSVARTPAPPQAGGGQRERPQIPHVDGLPIFKPPYARVTAIDMNEGDPLWVAPLGDGPRAHPLLRDLDLPKLGAAYSRGSVLVTKSLLFVAVSRIGSFGPPEFPTETWEEFVDPAETGKLMYVFDKQSGELLREIAFDSNSAAAPMTYMHGGKQYVVVAMGAGTDSELVALSLPGNAGN